MIKRLVSAVTYANIVATIAVLFALSGAAYAVKMYSGKNIANNTLQNSDFKTASLGTADLGLEAKAALVGARGATGAKGGIGATGTKGGKGIDGVLGSPAKLTSSWAQNDTGLVTSSGLPIPNSPATDWDDPNYGTDFPDSTPNLRQIPELQAGQSDYTPVNISATDAPLIRLTDMAVVSAPAANSSNGVVKLPWAANLSATATVTLLHRADGEDWQTNGGATPGTLLHDRVQCWLGYGAAGGNPATYTQMGRPVYASSGVKHELLQVSIVADADTTAGKVPAGDYNVAVMCHDPDTTATPSSIKWSFVSGNLTVLGAG